LFALKKKGAQVKSRHIRGTKPQGFGTRVLGGKLIRETLCENNKERGSSGSVRPQGTLVGKEGDALPGQPQKAKGKDGGVETGAKRVEGKHIWLEFASATKTRKNPNIAKDPLQKVRKTLGWGANCTRGR